MSTFRNRYKLWPTLYVLYPYIILHACIQWRHNLHIRLHMQSLRYRPGSMNRIVSKHSNGYLYFYCSRAIIYTKTLKQIHLSVIIFKHFIYRDNWITQLPKTISNNQQVSWKENNDTDMILYTLRSLRQYLKAIERQANRVNQQRNLCLQYLHISMSTSFTDRATKISTLTIERSWHNTLQQGIGQNTYSNYALIFKAIAELIKSKTKRNHPFTNSVQTFLKPLFF